MPHTIQLTNGAAALLSNALNAPGKVQGLKELASLSAFASHYEGFSMPEPGTLVGWAAQPWKTGPVEITETQRESIKAVLTRCADEKVLPPSKFALELLTAFGLAE